MGSAVWISGTCVGADTGFEGAAAAGVSIG